jgi:hypothetical protein
MCDSFPAVETVSMKDAEPGSIVRISRYDGPKLALVTDETVNGVRSFIWLNPNFQNKPTVIFAENWRTDPSVLQYKTKPRFELGTADGEIDPTGHNSWDVIGVLVSIGNDLFIRAAQEEFYGRYKLINVRTGSIYSDRLPDTLWTFLSWQLWLRDPIKQCDALLTAFRVRTEARV